MSGRSITLKDVPADKFIATYSAHLKKSGKINLPAWVDVVKTGHFKELAPVDPDWFYVRCASLARLVYIRPAGIGAYRRHFGGAKNNGAAPFRKALASESVIRKALQELEQIGVLEKGEDGGRRVTSKGRREIDRMAALALTQ